MALLGDTLVQSVIIGTRHHQPRLIKIALLIEPLLADTTALLHQGAQIRAPLRRYQTHHRTGSVQKTGLAQGGVTTAHDHHGLPGQFQTKGKKIHR